MEDIVKDKRELIAKIDNLNRFMKSDEFKNYGAREQELLMGQLAAMSTYAMILGLRTAG